VCKLRNLLGLACIALAAVVSIKAQTQVATVASAAVFHLRGALIAPGQGIPNWPVLAGDIVSAETAPIIVSFPDGSVIVLAAYSAAKIGMIDNIPAFQLVGGSATYSLKTLTAVKLINPATQIAKLTALKGTLGIHSIALLTPVTVGLAAVGGATAVGLGMAIEANTGGDAVSPSR
jgi:hypothetical protein